MISTGYRKHVRYQLGWYRRSALKIDQDTRCQHRSPRLPPLPREIGQLHHNIIQASEQCNLSSLPTITASKHTLEGTKTAIQLQANVSQPLAGVTQPETSLHASTMLSPCLSCPAERRETLGSRLWRDMPTQSCRRWSWSEVPWACRSLLRSRSVRYRHPLRAQTRLFLHWNQEHTMNGAREYLSTDGSLISMEEVAMTTKSLSKNAGSLWGYTGCNYYVTWMGTCARLLC